jgi:5-formyltetrahydrofolate cyclo-ligase
MTQSGELKKAKRALRRNVLARRDAMSDDERRRAGAMIVERFIALPEVVAADTVMAFWSFGSEVDTRPLLDALAARGTAIVLPRIEEGRLEPRRWAPGEPLEQTWFGASEPVAGTPIDPVEIDVVAVPGVAFDRLCRRLGYGGGFYDRFLLRLRPDALRAAIGFSCQVVDEPVPTGAFDLRIDALVTEVEVFRLDRDEA